MSRDYWLGVATTPVLLVACALLFGIYLLLFTRHTADGIGCARCDWHHETRHNAWWLSELKWRRHRRSRTEEAKRR